MNAKTVIAASPLHPVPGNEMPGAIFIALICATAMFYGIWMVADPTRFLNRHQDRLEKVAFGNTKRLDKQKSAQLELHNLLNTANPGRSIRTDGILIALVCAAFEVAIWRNWLFAYFFK